MPAALYRPLYATWLAIYLSMVLGVVTWIVGSLLGLPSVFDEGYRAFPSGLLLVFVIMGVIAASTFLASFTGRKWMGVVAFPIFTFLAVLVLIVLDWLLDTWDATTLLVVVIMFAIIVVGLVAHLYRKNAVIIATWLVLSVAACAVVLGWVQSTWGTSFLFYLMVVAAVAAYVVVMLTYVLVPKSLLEA